VTATAALFRAGFRHQASFRFALVSGVLTNAFFGVVRTSVFLAVYRETQEVGGLEQADAVTYVWILQATFAVVWAPWMLELAHRIRSGEWTAELLRPGSLFGRHFAYDAGRTSAILLLRAPLPLAFAAVVFDLRLPTTPVGVAAAVASLALAGAVAVCVRFLVGAIAFWTPDFRGVYALVFGPLFLLSGFVIPVELFPTALRWFAALSPLGALLRAPVAVATGRDVPEAIASQLLWVAAMVVVCHAVLRRATRRMVVFGG
jgi:ABC-2 type transport system permease protein